MLCRCRNTTGYLLRLTASSIKHSPTRWFAALGGIALAFFLLCGTNQAVRWAAGGEVSVVLQDLAWDATIEPMMNGVNGSAASQLLGELAVIEAVEQVVWVCYSPNVAVVTNLTRADGLVDHARSADPTNLGRLGDLNDQDPDDPGARLEAWERLGPGDASSIRCNALGLAMVGDGEEVLARLGLSSNHSFALSPSQALVESGLARLLMRSFDLRIGANITVVMRQADGLSQAFCVTVVGFFTVMDESYYPANGPTGLGMLAPTPGIITSPSPGYGKDLSPYTGVSQGLVFLDRQRLIDPYDLEKTNNALWDLLSKLEIRASKRIPSGVVIDNVLGDALVEEMSGISRLNEFYVVLGLPVLALGIVLAYLGQELVQLSERDEISSLLSRGASRSQILVLLVLQGGLMGLVAAGLGGVLGPALFLFLPILNLPGLGSMPHSAQTGLLRLGPVLLVLVLGAFVGALAAYLAGREKERDAILYPTWSQSYTRWSQDPTPPRQRGQGLYLALVTVPSLFFAAILLGRVTGPGILQAIMNVLSVVGYASLPIFPVLLILGLSGIATSSNGLFWFAARIFRFHSDISDLATSALKRDTQEISRIALLVALCLGFGVFFSTYWQSEKAWDREEASAYLPSDIWVFAPGQGEPGSIRQVAETVGGVEAASEMVIFEAETRAGTIPLVAVDPPSLEQCVSRDKRNTAISSELGRLLAANQIGVVSSHAAAKIGGWRRGDPVQIQVLNRSTSVMGERYRLELTILGEVEYLPGSYVSKMTHTRPMAPPLIVSLAEMPEGPSPMASVLLVSTDGSVPDQVVAREIASKLGLAHPAHNPREEGMVVTWDEKMREMVDSPVDRPLRAYLVTETMMVIGVAALGLALTMFVVMSQKYREISICAVRGMSKSQLVTWLVGEGLVAALIGCGVGFLCGYVTGLGYANLEGVLSTKIVGVPVVLPWQGSALVVLCVASLLSTVLAVSLYATTLDIGPYLRRPLQ